MESSGRFERIFFKMIRENNTGGALGAPDVPYADGDARLPFQVGGIQTRKGSPGGKNKKKKTDGLDKVYLTGEEGEEYTSTHPGYKDTTWSDGGVTITMQEVEEELAKQGFSDAKGGVQVDLKDIEHLDIHTRHKPNKTPKEVEKTKKRAMEADTDYSIIVSKKDDVYVEVLDGNHRLHKVMELRRDDKNASDTITVRPLDLSKVPEEWVSVFG